MAKEMLINTVEGQECRIALVCDGALEELYVERMSSASRVGNIYKGRITNVEPSIQAAFVDFGGGKNGFLHVSDVHPQFFPDAKDPSEPVGRKCPQRERPPIQKCLRRGQEIVVQVTKEGIGTKGPTLTTYFSIAGRLLVMMPGMSRTGVSRKIEDEADRARARKILDELTLPPDVGFILRTAGLGSNKRELQRDLNYLLRLRRAIRQHIRETKAPAEIYRESDLVVRTIRDVYTTDIERIICDRQADARRVKEFLDMAMPRTKYRIEYYTGKEGLFHEYGLEEEIEKIHSRRVELPSGGSLVIDQTEALVAIDVNSGRFRDHSDAETTAVKNNQEAAVEIARQLRLRDLGGVIVIDFIDMRHDRNRRAVERTLRQAIKPDRAKTKILRISALGIVEMTRQRMRPSLQASVYGSCPTCGGSGMIKSPESLALVILRDLNRALARDEIARVEVRVAPPVANHLSNRHRAEIAGLEQQTGKAVVICGEAGLAAADVQFACFSPRSTPVPWQPQQPHGKPKGRPKTIPVEQLPPAPQTELALQPLPGELDEEEALLREEIEDSAAAPAGAPAPQPEGQPRKKRRRRGGRRKKQATQGQPAPEGEAPQAAGEAMPQPAPQVQPEADDEPAAGEPAPGPAAATPAPGEQPPAKKRRRGRRGGRRHKKKTPPGEAGAPQTPPTPLPQPQP